MGRLLEVVNTQLTTFNFLGFFFFFFQLNKIALRVVGHPNKENILVGRKTLKSLGISQLNGRWPSPIVFYFNYAGKNSNSYL
jgi:hypothetical protein